MKLFSTYFPGKCKGLYDQKSKNAAEEDRWTVDNEEEQQKETWEDESQPLINLGLGIGGPSFCSPRRRPDDNRGKDNSFDRKNMKVEMMKQKGIVFDIDDHDHDYDDDDQVVEKVEYRKSSVVMFTEEQVEELKRQVLIYNYMVWGLPVPFQLLLPIWRSFSSSSCVPPHFYLYKNYSPFLLTYFRSGVNHKHTMDPEPGRCRRTDGKKWRCQQDVIPNEKYCEKHMHRGSKRSRKLVEAPPKSRTHNFVNLIRNNNFIRDIKSKFHQENLDQNGPTKVVLGTPGLTNTTAKSKNTKLIEAKHDNIVVNERIAVVNRASGMDFSPRSVLQNDRGMKCPRVESPKKNQDLSESRCKRTDGKKWQCKKEVVPDRKYCAQHINRGRMRSEKSCLGSSASGFEAPYGSTSSGRAHNKAEQSKVGMSLDTNLKISLPTRQADPRNIIKGSMARDGSGTAGTSSTEATESDESTGFSDTIVLSP